MIFTLSHSDIKMYEQPICERNLHTHTHTHTHPEMTTSAS